jgi:hypothetical protein
MMLLTLAMASTALAADRLRPDVVDETLSFVVPPNLEKVISDMLGGDDLLPGACRLHAARAEGSWIRAQWECGADKTLIGAFLQHPSVGGVVVFETDRLKVKQAEPRAWPAGFAQALQSRLAAKGSAFEWQATTRIEIPPGTFPAPAIPPGTEDDGSSRPSPAEAGGVPWYGRVQWTYVVLGLVASWWMFTRVRRWREAARARADIAASAAQEPPSV